MNVSDMILTELEFPKIFAKYKKKEYGLFFYNEKNRLSRDSNHAILYGERLKDLHSALEEIKDFYLPKGITPVVYHPYINGFLKKNRPCFRNHGYSIKTYSDETMLLTGGNTINVPRRLKILRLTEWDERIAAQICEPDGTGYIIGSIKKALKSDRYHLFVGYLGSTAVTMASLQYSEYGCARLDDVHTAKAFRGNGYSRELIRAVVQNHKQNSDADFYLWTGNPTAKRIYQEAGFTRTPFQFETWSAEFINRGGKR